MGSGPRETKSYLDVMSFMSGMLTELSPEPPPAPLTGVGAVGAHLARGHGQWLLSTEGVR